ncbi:MAG: hypothetical protein ACTSR8_14255 [Promethearchaeota archaeon]
MGFITTIIIIYLLATFSHRWYHKYGLKKQNIAWIAYFGIVVVLGFLILDVLIYIGLFNFIFPLLNTLPWVDIENGRDFMWNSFQLFGIDFGLNYNDPGLIPIAILLFLSYLPWYVYAKLLSKILFGGHNSYEEGYWWALAPTKKPKDEMEIVKAPE